MSKCLSYRCSRMRHRVGRRRSPACRRSPSPVAVGPIRSWPRPLARTARVDCGRPAAHVSGQERVRLTRARSAAKRRACGSGRITAIDAGVGAARVVITRLRPRLPWVRGVSCCAPHRTVRQNTGSPRPGGQPCRGRQRGRRWPAQRPPGSVGVPTPTVERGSVSSRSNCRPLYAGDGDLPRPRISSGACLSGCVSGNHRPASLTAGWAQPHLFPPGWCWRGSSGRSATPSGAAS